MAGQRDAIGFAEKVLELLDEGRYTATYKYAVLLALIDLCLEGTQASGIPPAMVTTRQLADKIVEIYWPHTAPFRPARADVLRQNASGQAEIVSAILKFRSRHAPDASAPRWHAQRAAPAAYERLVRTIEWKLIEMPLPRLQMMGQSHDAFIYEIHWDTRVQRRDVERRPAEDGGGFDNRVLLKPGVGDYLLQLNGLLRPLIQRRWAAMVAQLNRLEDARLETFLFGADRVHTARIRAGLWEIQGCRCFYCDERLREPTGGQVDHFVPWSRYPDDSLDNLVLADVACNGFKSSSLAAADHVVRWARRFVTGSAEHRQLDELAQQTAWEREPDRSVGVARGIYLRLPADARLWLRHREFVDPDAARLAAALAGSA
ncbi:MAG TPA: HNH endonuclease domain-containing protein [Methylomirabilota bacterium]